MSGNQLLSDTEVRATGPWCDSVGFSPRAHTTLGGAAEDRSAEECSATKGLSKPSSKRRLDRPGCPTDEEFESVKPETSFGKWTRLVSS